MRVALFVTAAVATFSFTACAPSVDGGWNGDAQCGNNDFPLDAIFNEDADGNLDGVIYINNVFGGLIAKGNIEDGERKDDGTYKGDLQTDDDSTPEFKFDFTFDEKDVDRIRGDVDVLDNNGDKTDSCDLDMDRTSVND